MSNDTTKKIHEQGKAEFDALLKKVQGDYDIIEAVACPDNDEADLADVIRAAGRIVVELVLAGLGDDAKELTESMADAKELGEGDCVGFQVESIFSNLAACFGEDN